MSHIASAVTSLEETTRRIESIVRPLPHELLTWRPTPDVWSIMDNLAHIEEFVPFWIGEMRAMLADPPQLWGRDQRHAGRLEAVRDTSSRELDALLRNIQSEIANAAKYLHTLNDSALETEAVSRNPNWATKPVSFVLDTLLVKHLSDHCNQIQRNIQQYKKG